MKHKLHNGKVILGNTIEDNLNALSTYMFTLEAAFIFLALV